MPSIGLSMIMKNAGDLLPPCLQSVQGLASQIVIADTGSTDGSAERARELGAEVVSFPWINDYAAARNAALEPMRTDWVLVLDCDEELSASAREKIPALLAGAKPSVGGYYLYTRNFLPPGVMPPGYAALMHRNDDPHPRAVEAAAYADVEICRLFRRDPRLRFQNRIHEIIDPVIVAAGLQVLSSRLVIEHFGPLIASEERVLEKREMYLAITEQEVAERPNDVRALTELGLEHLLRGDIDRAQELLERAVALPGRMPAAFTSLASIYLSKGQNRKVVAMLEPAIYKNDLAGERDRLLADAYFNLGDLKKSREAYLRAIKSLPDAPRVEARLALCEVRMGMKKMGLNRVRATLARCPEDGELHDSLVRCLIAVGDLPAAALACEVLARGARTPECYLRAASIRAQLGEWLQVSALLDEALKLFPAHERLLQARAEIAMHLPPPPAQSSEELRS